LSTAPLFHKIHFGSEIDGFLSSNCFMFSDNRVKKSTKMEHIWVLLTRAWTWEKTVLWVLTRFYFSIWI